MNINFNVPSFKKSGLSLRTFKFLDLFFEENKIKIKEHKKEFGRKGIIFPVTWKIPTFKVSDTKTYVYGTVSFDSF